jgi:hypothetical protein
VKQTQRPTGLRGDDTNPDSMVVEALRVGRYIKKIYIYTNTIQRRERERERD